MEPHTPENTNSKNVKDFSGRLAFIFLTGIFALMVIGTVMLNFGNRAAKIEVNTTFDRAAYESYQDELKEKEKLDAYWEIPELYLLEDEEQKDLIRYGKELIRHTSRYLGPNGSVKKLSNGMNCQNCHLDAGTRIWGNNYAGVASTYPKVRARSGKMENIEKRVNDCFERSLNGQALENDSKEMRAIVAYLKFLGTNVKKGEVPEGTGIYDIPFLKRPADPVKGKAVYDAKCASCHGANGEGMMANAAEYSYPPLWGPNSYNSGAGLFRMSRLAGYVRYNMPYGASFLKPQMSVEDSWDVAAFINTQPRPGKDISKDWPDISKKPIDHPFGPYADGFTEAQHKFGPFGPIKSTRKK